MLVAVSDERTAAAEGASAFTQRREPASIAKLITSAAAYRAGQDADVEIRRMTCGGVERYGGKPLWCAFAAGPLEGLDHALALSCNVAFANLGTRLGPERMVAEYRLWGFDAGEDALLGAAGRVHTSRARRGSWPTSRWGSSSPTSRRSTRPSSPPSWRTAGGCPRRAW